MTNVVPEEYAAQARNRYAAVLVLTDGSDEAQRAAERGVELAAALDETVHALSVIEGPGTLKRDQLRGVRRNRCDPGLRRRRGAVTDTARRARATPEADS